MAKSVKKVDPKAVAKSTVMSTVADALRGAGLEVLDGAQFGMTAGTIVVRTPDTDIQIKPITPKAGIVRYEVAVEE